MKGLVQRRLEKFSWSLERCLLNTPVWAVLGAPHVSSYEAPKKKIWGTWEIGGLG